MTHSLLCLLCLCGLTSLSFEFLCLSFCTEWKNRLNWPQPLQHDYFDTEHCHDCQVFSDSSCLCRSSLSPSASLWICMCLHPAIALFCVFLLTFHYFVTLPEICHYSSSVIVGKWTCCGLVNFSFSCLWLSLSDLQLSSITLLPLCGSVWQPENTISLIIWIIWSSFAFDCKTINTQTYWWMTCNLSHQLTSKTGLITFPLRLFGPQGSGSGFGSVCAVFLSGLHDPLPLNEGEQGWEMRHFRAQGFIPTAQWITLQRTKGRRDSFFKKSFALNTNPDHLTV